MCSCGLCGRVVPGHLRRAQVQSPPPAPTRARVIAATPATADPAPPASSPRRADMNDENLGVLVELDILDDRLLDPQQGTP